MKAHLSWIFLMVIILFPLLFPPVIHAYKLEHDENGDVLHWSVDDFPIPYKVTVRTPVPASAFRQAVGNAFATWQAVKNARITFQAAGNTPNLKPAYDGKNCVVMQDNTSGSDVIGQAYIFYSTDSGRILDVDIALNSAYRWGTDGAPDKMDVQNAMTHEVGHLCGLDDLYAKEDSEKTMYGYMDYGETKKRTLDPDDAAGLAAIYPVENASDSGGGGSSGCGTISPTAPPPHSGDINFLWIFLLMAALGLRYLFSGRLGTRPS